MNTEPERVARNIIDRYGLDTGNAEAYESDGVLHVAVVAPFGATATATLPATTDGVLIEASVLYTLTVASRDKAIHPQDAAFFGIGVRRLRGDVPSPARAARALLADPRSIAVMADALRRYDDGTPDTPDRWRDAARAALKALVPTVRHPHTGPAGGGYEGTHESGASTEMNV